MTPDESKVWTPEEARKLADSPSPHGTKSITDGCYYCLSGAALHSLAATAEALYVENAGLINDARTFDYEDLVRTRKELAEARAEIERLKRRAKEAEDAAVGVVGSRWATWRAHYEIVKAERDALQAKYDAAVEVAKENYDGPSDGVEQLIAAKLANAAEEVPEANKRMGCNHKGPICEA